MRELNNEGFISPLAIFLSIALLMVIGFSGYRIYKANEQPSANETAAKQEVLEVAKGEAFTFSAAADFTSNKNANLVLRGIGAANTDFSLALGDMGYGGNGTEQAWCNFVKERVGDQPFQLIAGNHDDGLRDGDIAEYRKCLPDKLGSARGDYGVEYYFDYNNLARFILISPDINNYGYDYAKGTNNYNWVSTKIDEAREEGLQWVVLGMHKNCITPGVKSCETGEDIMNLAIEKNVDLVLQGHEHGYFRSKQLGLNNQCPVIVANTANSSCITGQGNQFFSGNGTVFVITGAGGAKLRDVDLGDFEIGYFETWNGANTGNSYGFSEFEVSFESIKAKFVSVGSGKYEDGFVIEYQN